MEKTNNANNSFTDIFDESFSPPSPPMSLPESPGPPRKDSPTPAVARPSKYTGQYGQFRSVQEIDPKYKSVFSYPYFNLIQSRIIDDALYSDKSIVVCAPTGSGKTVIFEMAIVQLLMELDDRNYTGDFKIIYMAPVKALCTERLSEWYPKFTPLGHLCIEVTGDTDVDFAQLASYKIIITTPEKWDMLTRRWREFRTMVEVIKLFLIDEVHILHDDVRGPVLEAVVSRMKTIEASIQAEHRIKQAHIKIQNAAGSVCDGNTAQPPRIRFVAVSATVSNPEDVASWIGTTDYPAVYYKMGEECRPVKLKRVVEGYHCPEGANVFKFDLMLSYKLWPIIEKYYNGKPTLIFCNTRKSVAMTAEVLAREVTINFSEEQRAKLAAVAFTIRDKKLQDLVTKGVGFHHAGLLLEERLNIEQAFRMRDLPILVTTTTLAMGVNLPAHLVIIKCTQQYINGQYQEYSVSTVLQMMGRAGRPQFDTEATAVIMTRSQDKSRYASLVDGSGPLESSLHLRLAEHLNSEVALCTVQDIAQGVQWARSTFLHVRAARDPRRYLGLPANPPPPPQLISQRIQDLCVTAMNGLASAGLITMDEASCVTATPAGRLMSLYCLDFDTMKLIMKIKGDESLQQLLWLVCQSHELAGLQLRTDERRTLNLLNRNTAAPATTVRYPVKGKISTKQSKFYCIIQAIFGCLHIPDPSLHQEAMKLLRTADRICKCMVAYITRDEFTKACPPFLEAVVNSITLAKCCTAQLWPDSPYVSRQLRGIGPALSTALASAGKTTFMLIEESHPRDLERIMNKGAPAGNVLRKQVSMLPKYQLTAEQTNFDTILVTLTLLNASYMADNNNQLTAGENHKSYIVVGDSENCILLCGSFKDKDLMTSTNGTILYSVKRRNPFRHSLHIFCISSSFVDLDVKTSVTINGYERPPEVDLARPTKDIGHTTSSLGDTQNTNKTKPNKKQTVITDTLKERKRRSNVNESAKEIAPKNKKDCKSIENFKSIRDACYGLQPIPTLGHTPKAINVCRQNQSEEAHKTGKFNKTYEHSTLYNSPEAATNEKITKVLTENFDTNKLDQLVNYTNKVEIPNTHDYNIDNLLKDIEKEMESTENVKNISSKNTNSQKCMKTLKSLPIATNIHTTIDDGKNTQFCNKFIFAQDGNSEKLPQKTTHKREILGPSSGLTKVVHRSYSKYRDLVYNEGTSSDEGEVSKQNGFTDKVMPNLCNYLQNASSKMQSHNENSINLPTELMQNSDENANDDCDNTISEKTVCETTKQAKCYKENEENVLTVSKSKPENDQTELTGIAEVSKHSDKYPAKSSEKSYNPIVLPCTHDSLSEKESGGYSLHKPNTYLDAINTQFYEYASTTKSTENVNLITGFLKERTEENSRITLKKSSNLQSTDKIMHFIGHSTPKTQRMLTPQSDEAKVFKLKNPLTKCNLVPVMSLKNNVTREDRRNAPIQDLKSNVTHEDRRNAPIQDTPQSDEAKVFKLKNPLTKCNLVPVMSLKNNVTREDRRNAPIQDLKSNVTHEDRRNAPIQDTPPSDEAKVFKLKNPLTKCNLLPVMSLKSNVTREDRRNAPIQDSISKQTVEITENLKVELQIKSTYTKSGVDVQKTGFMKCEEYSKIVGTNSTIFPLKRKFDKAFAQPQELTDTINQDKDNKYVTLLSYDKASQVQKSQYTWNVNENIEQICTNNKQTMRSGQRNVLQMLPKINFEKFHTNNSSGILKEINVNDKTEVVSDELAKPMVKCMTVVLKNKNVNNHTLVQKDTQNEDTLQMCKNTIPSQQEQLQVENNNLKSVSNILQKYSSVLSNAANADECEDAKYVQKEDKGTSQKAKAKQRRFKVQEIDQLNINTSPFIDFEEMEQGADETLTILNSYNGKPTEVELPLSEYKDEDSFNMIDILSYSQDIDLLSSRKTNEIDENLQQKDLDISQFDPKCLLASCETYLDNLIPPPPSFRDNEELQNMEQSVETWSLNTDGQDSTDWISVRNRPTRTEPLSMLQNLVKTFKYKPNKEKIKPQKKNVFSTPYLWGTVKK